MKTEDLANLLDSLSTARIFAGAEMGRLCDKSRYTEALIFQSIRDNIAQNIHLLESYSLIRREDSE